MTGRSRTAHLPEKSSLIHCSCCDGKIKYYLSENSFSSCCTCVHQTSFDCVKSMYMTNLLKLFFKRDVISLSANPKDIKHNLINAFTIFFLFFISFHSTSTLRQRSSVNFHYFIVVCWHSFNALLSEPWSRRIKRNFLFWRDILNQRKCMATMKWPDGYDACNLLGTQCR